MAYTSKRRKPPLVFVLSEKSCKILLFPLIYEKEKDIIDCLLLPDIPVWIENDFEGSLNRKFLLILLLSCREHKEWIRIKYPGESTQKSLIKSRILTVEQLMEEKLLQQKEEKIQELTQQLQELTQPLETQQLQSQQKRGSEVSFLEGGSSSTTTVLLRMCKLSLCSSYGRRRRRIVKRCDIS